MRLQGLPLWIIIPGYHGFSRNNSVKPYTLHLQVSRLSDTGCAAIITGCSSHLCGLRLGVLTGVEQSNARERETEGVSAVGRETPRGFHQQAVLG